MKANAIESIEPLAVPKRTVFRMIGSVRIVQRWLFFSRDEIPEEERWLKVALKGGAGRQTLIDYASVKAAYARMLEGDLPPLLPCEVRRQDSRSTATSRPSRRGRSSRKGYA